jgi:putative ABC transport system permease protein
MHCRGLFVQPDLLTLLLQPPNSSGSFTYEGQQVDNSNHNPFADFHSVTPGFFETMQTPILQGRDFGSEDKIGLPKSAIINREMAEKLWPGRSALGKHIHCCSNDGDYVIVGVAKDIRYAGPDSTARFEIYTDAARDPPLSMGFLIRTSGDPLSLSHAVSGAAFSIGPEVPVANVTSLERAAQLAIAGQRTSTVVMGFLGCLALMLASIGVYGVMAYSVSRREREFGIRIALGANRHNILSLVLRGAMLFVFMGVIIGGGLTFGLRAWVESRLGASGASPGVMLCSGLLLCTVALLATVFPAARATRVQPVDCLKAE